MLPENVGIKILKLCEKDIDGGEKFIPFGKNAVMKAGQHAYKHRRQKKREFRQLWILRISAAPFHTKFVFSLYWAQRKKIVINRKMLADLAVQKPRSIW